MKLSDIKTPSLILDADRVRKNAGRITNIAIELLNRKRHPMRTRELLAELTALGIQIGGAEPVNNLSGILSRAERLKSSRTQGWSLVEWDQHDQMPESDRLSSNEKTDPAFRGNGNTNIKVDVPRNR